MTDTLTPAGYAAIVQSVRDAAFDGPFHLSREGVVTSALYAPDVFHDDETDVVVCSTKWEALTGYTGQYGYSGAVMHPSEHMSNRMVRDMLEDPGIYAVTVVECLPTDEDEDPEPAGWCVLRYVGDL